MFYISYEKDGSPGWGILGSDKTCIYPADKISNSNVPLTLLDYIKIHQEKSVSIESFKSSKAIPLENVHITAPIPEPQRNIFCVGRNYLDHIKEIKKGLDIQQESKHPNFFTKATNTVIGPFDDIPSHKGITDSIDYEVELAVIIGRGGINISEEAAMDYVFGYTILNDVTARDLQKIHYQWLKGKSLDGFCPMGPWIATRDEFDEPLALSISSRVNGELRQSANTKDLMFSIPRLISILSQGLTLMPGDIIATGTPSGVGMGFEPPRFLRQGDIVKMEIEGIGIIENKIG